MVVLMFLFFFFKQKTAYEMRISDWSSDVCSSDLIDADLPMLVTDERAFRQMLLNLLGNAVKFTPAGGRVVLAARIEQDGRMAVGVADTGIGMKKEDLPRALEPFVPLHHHLSTSYGGAGRGLPLEIGRASCGAGVCRDV